MVDFRKLLLSIVVVGMAGCDDTVEKYELKASYEGSDIVVRVAGGGLPGDKSHSIVRGHILISSEKKISSVNLSCFQLGIDGEATQKIYVDSPAHFNVGMVLPNDSGEIDFPVYWTINGDVYEYNFEMVSLDIRGAGCITYAE